MTASHKSDEQATRSDLALGNEALRASAFEKAITLYLRALSSPPAVARQAALNIHMARRRAALAQTPTRRLRAGVCTHGDVPLSSRALALCSGYAAFAEVTLIGPKADAAGTDRRPDMRIEALGRADEGFIHDAAMLVMRRPLDILHLCLPSAGGGIVVALLYKLVWGSRVLVDVDEHGVSTGDQGAPADLPALLAGLRGMTVQAPMSDSRWAPVAAWFLPRLDGLTGSSAAALRGKPGTVVADLPKDADTLRRLHGGSPSTAQASALLEEAAQLLHALPVARGLKPLLVLAATSLPNPEAAPRAQRKPTVAAPPPTAPAPKAMATPPIAPAAEQRTLPPRLPPLLPASPAADFAWTASPRLAATAHRASLELLSTPVALCSAAAAPAADGELLQPLHALLGLLGRARVGAIALRRGGTAQPLDATTAHTVAGSCRWALGPTGFVLADLWLTSDAGLRLRIERPGQDAQPGAPTVLRGFQFDPQRAELVASGDTPLTGAALAFADITLANPYCPLLLVLTAPDGELLASSLLPFPSLCRGGAHHGELSFIGRWPAYMANLADVSNGLLLECLSGANATAPPSVGCIEVDLTAANGSERIFTRTVREWLTSVMALPPLQPLHLPSPDVSTTPVEPFLLALLQAPAGTVRPPHGGELKLTLAADTLPTISALVSRRLSLPAGGELAIGSFVVAHEATGRPLSLVTMPPMDAPLLALQPNGQATPFPRLSRLRQPTQTGVRADASAALVALLPLGVRAAGAAPTGPALMHRVSLDSEGPLLRRTLDTAERASARITVVVSAPSADTDLSPLLGSLSRQTLSAAIDVMVLSPDTGDAAAPLRRALQATFPSRHTVLQSRPGPRAVHLNAAATQARGSHLLLAGPDALLHDPRTLETLLTLTSAPRVATAACVLLREVSFKKGTEVRFHSGGMFPKQVSFSSRPWLVFDEPYTMTAFPQATYPVVANSFRLTLVRTAVWAELGGLDADTFALGGDDLDFCLRALKAGYRHLCTSAVTASYLQDGGPAEHTDTHAQGFMPNDRWQDVLGAVAVVRHLEG